MTKYIYDTHYCDVIIGAMASQITSLTIVYSTVYSDADQSRHHSSASLAFVRGIHGGGGGDIRGLMVGVKSKLLYKIVEVFCNTCYGKKYSTDLFITTDIW